LGWLLQMNPLSQVVTAAEWAKLCGVSPQYIRRICAEGKLNARQTAEGVWLIVKPDKESQPCT
jgi:predicted site-specific integrase-resolvase